MFRHIQTAIAGARARLGVLFGSRRAQAAAVNAAVAATEAGPVPTRPRTWSFSLPRRAPKGQTGLRLVHSAPVIDRALVRAKAGRAANRARIGREKFRGRLHRTARAAGTTLRGTAYLRRPYAALARAA